MGRADSVLVFLKQQSPFYLFIFGCLFSILFKDFLVSLVQSNTFDSLNYLIQGNQRTDSLMKKLSIYIYIYIYIFIYMRILSYTIKLLIYCFQQLYLR